MDISFYTAAVSAQQQQVRLDVHANNIANVNTYGFRTRRPTFANLMTRNLQGISEDIPRGAGSKLESAEPVFSTMGVHRTGRLLDFAIEGEGFFALTDPATEGFTFTRDGSFTLSRFQRMETPESAPTYQTVILEDGSEGTIEIPGAPQAPRLVTHWYLSDGQGRFVLDPNGQIVEVDDPGDVTVNTVLNVGVFDFINYNGMQSSGDNRLTPVEKNGQVRVGSGRAVQGMLEDSNVDLAYEIAKVIETQRSFSLMLRMVTTSDEITNTVNGLRG